MIPRNIKFIMKQNFTHRSIFKRTPVIFMFSLLLSLGYACGNTKSAENEQAQGVDDEAFYETQPLHSGLYDASYFDITGTNARKGHFDGRLYFSLSPETSALYVFENGNRTKIDYMVNLQRPFEKGDSGVYATVDTKDRLVKIIPDSADYKLNFQRSGEDITITFNPKPRHTGSALDILEKMATQKKK